MNRLQSKKMIGLVGLLVMGVALRAAVAQDAATNAQNAAAQNAPAAPTSPVKGNSEIMVVLGTATPVPLAESQRSVEILPVKAESLAAESPQDFLRQDSS